MIIRTNIHRTDIERKIRIRLENKKPIAFFIDYARIRLEVVLQYPNMERKKYDKRIHLAVIASLRLYFCSYCRLPNG